MNKIVIRKDIKNNKIIMDNGEYILEYPDDGEYNITFVIEGNVKLIESSFDKSINVNNNYVIKEGSLEVIKFYNNLSVKEKINIDLMNDDCEVDYHFSNICRGNEEYIIDINHKHEDTKSNIINKSIALKNSNLNFIINSNVPKKSIKSILNQNTRIVTMGECDAKISPNMFIDIDDVEAKHGSIIGSFNEEQIFYLMSKGINYNDTLKLLIKGYLFSNISDELRYQVNDIIDTYWR